MIGRRHIERLSRYCALYAVMSASALSQTVYFSDGFESGDHSAWSDTSRTTANICSFDAPSIAAERSHSGRFSAKGAFIIGGPNSSCNGGGPPAPHQDKNIYDVKFIEQGLSRFRIGAWFYLKKAEGKTKHSHARKFFYVLAKGGAPRVVLASQEDEFAHQPSIYLSYNTGSGGSHSLYGGDSEVKTRDWSSANGILNLPYEQWFYLELAIAYKTRETATDSWIRVYYGTETQPRKEVFRKTKNWSTDRCSPSGSQACPPFPDDANLENRIKEFRVGAQADRQKNGPVDEIRYWDDVVIADP